MPVEKGDPSTLDGQELDRAEVELERQYGRPSLWVARGETVDVPADVLAWWRAADARRRQLIDATPVEPLHVGDVEPMERRRERLRKPGPPR
jgi:hypothetical protein